MEIGYTCGNDLVYTYLTAISEQFKLEVVIPLLKLTCADFEVNPDHIKTLIYTLQDHEEPNESLRCNIAVGDYPILRIRQAAIEMQLRDELDKLMHGLGDVQVTLGCGCLILDQLRARNEIHGILSRNTDLEPRGNTGLNSIYDSCINA